MASENESAYQVPAGKDVTIDVAPKGDTFTLEELRGHIGGGYIQTLDLRNGTMMVMDEEGKLKGLPVNRQATDVAHALGVLPSWDSISGDVLVIRNDQIS